MVPPAVRFYALITILIDSTKQLPTHLLTTRSSISHQTSRGRQNVDTHSSKHFGHGGAVDVHPAARSRDSLDFRHYLLTFWAIPQVDPHISARTLTDDFVIVNKALVLQYPRDLEFELRNRHIHFLMFGCIRVSNASEHIGYRICHTSPDFAIRDRAMR